MFLSDLIKEMKMRRQDVKKTDKPTLPKSDTPRHEYHNTGGGATLHRIVAGPLISNWFTYQQIATLKTSSGVLHACTDYFHGSLPTNAVFTIQEIK